MQRVDLRVNGSVFTGWTEITLTASMRAPAAAFSLSVRDPAWSLIPNAAAHIDIDGEQWLEGFIDRVEPNYDATSWSKAVQGRSRAGDLVDCAAIQSPDHWRGLTLGEFARIICAPFGVPVRVDTDSAAIPAIKLGDETAAAAIQKQAQIAGRVIMPTSDGGLRITTAAATPSGMWLAQGFNVVGASGVIDYTQRYRDYYVRAQAPFSDDEEPDAEVKVSGQARDDRITRYRPWRQTSGDSGNVAQVTARAAWEARVRAARSATIEVTVNRWKQDGVLWAPNTLVETDIPALRLSGRMLVEAVTFTQQGDSQRAQLSLVSPEAYSPEPRLVKKMTDADPWGAEEDDV